MSIHGIVPLSKEMKKVIMENLKLTYSEHLDKKHENVLGSSNKVMTNYFNTTKDLPKFKVLREI